jgi:hypothetical protein
VRIINEGTELVELDKLKPHPKNPRQGDVGAIHGSIEANGFYGSVIAQKSTGHIIAGNHRYLAAKHANAEAIPVTWVDVSDEEAVRILLADNRTNDLASYNDDALAELLQDLMEQTGSLDGTGFDGDALDELLQDIDAASNTERQAAEAEQKTNGTLATRFGVPPFTVLNAREGYWQERKRAWASLGIRSELGRADELMFKTPNDTKIEKRVHPIEEGGKVWTEVRAALRHAIKTSGLTGAQVDKHCGTVGMVGHWIGNSQPSIPTPEKWAQLKEILPNLPTTWDREMLETEEVEADANGTAQRIYDTTGTGTSLFDPVLCELAVSWFSPQGGTVLDPFAGGSVRGVVASKLGRQYIGVELRAEQVEANREQAATICGDPQPVWHTGDSRNVRTYCHDVQADFVFSCPPYADLEVYSDDPADLSTLNYAEFRKAYREIIAETCALLRNDRFACFVVGDVRDKHGNYYNFVGDTVEAFKAAGLHFYNEAILVTAVGSLPIRAGKQFSAGRKLGKTHQNVLVFVKGDGKKAADACGEVQVYTPEETEAE